jgi:FkbM family methyltransferase
MKRIILNKLIRLLTRVYDPLVTVRIGNQRIKAPLSHALKGILRVYPDFGFNITRLVGYIDGQYPAVAVIDIGANIGDTAAFVNNYKDLPVLCIDGDPKYFGLLQSNIKAFSGTSACFALVGASDGEIQKELVRDKGTAWLKDSGHSSSFRSLDTILMEYPSFKTSKFLKIDTDGFDVSILMGSKNFLVREQPVLFFEYDPGLITAQGQHPLDIFGFLRECGYEYMLVYQNNGDYLLSLRLSSGEETLIDLANYYMGRATHLYGDLCLFSQKDKALFETARKGEIAHFARARKFDLTR